MRWGRRSNTDSRKKKSSVTASSSSAHDSATGPTVIVSPRPDIPASESSAHQQRQQGRPHPPSRSAHTVQYATATGVTHTPSSASSSQPPRPVRSTSAFSLSRRNNASTPPVQQPPPPAGQRVGSIHTRFRGEQRDLFAPFEYRAVASVPRLPLAPLLPITSALAATALSQPPSMAASSVAPPESSGKLSPRTYRVYDMPGATGPVPPPRHCVPSGSATDAPQSAGVLQQHLVHAQESHLSGNTPSASHSTATGNTSPFSTSSQQVQIRVAVGPASLPASSALMTRRYPCRRLPLNSMRASAKAVSTYPQNDDTGKRFGDPICDQFIVCVAEECTLFSLADGCGWSARTREAAVEATNAFVERVLADFGGAHDTLDITGLLLDAISSANSAITRGKSHWWEAGTTTLVGGVMLPLSPELNGDPNFGVGAQVLLLVSVGDCKAYQVSVGTGRVTDLIPDSRVDSSDPSDCGGRLGPTVEIDGEDDRRDPDLRNMVFHSSIVKPGDFVIVCTDGLHDNLDPEVLGLSPSIFKLKDEHWKDIRPLKVTSLKGKFAEVLLNGLLRGLPRQHAIEEAIKRCNSTVPFVQSKVLQDLTPQQVVELLCDYSMKITAVLRSYMEQHPGAKQPNSPEDYPGKMDHTSVVCMFAPYPSAPPPPEFALNSGPLSSIAPSYSATTDPRHNHDQGLSLSSSDCGYSSDENSNSDRSSPAEERTTGREPLGLPTSSEKDDVVSSSSSVSASASSAVSVSSSNQAQDQSRESHRFETEVSSIPGRSHSSRSRRPRSCSPVPRLNLSKVSPVMSPSPAGGRHGGDGVFSDFVAATRRHAMLVAVVGVVAALLAATFLLRALGAGSWITMAVLCSPILLVFVPSDRIHKLVSSFLDADGTRRHTRPRRASSAANAVALPPSNSSSSSSSSPSSSPSSAEKAAQQGVSPSHPSSPLATDSSSNTPSAQSSASPRHQQTEPSSSSDPTSAALSSAHASSVSISLRTLRQVESTKRFMVEYYGNLINYLASRKERLYRLNDYIESRPSLTPAQVHRLRETHYAKESQLLRLRRAELSVRDFTCLALLGKGAFGKVHLARKKDTGELLALKSMPKTSLNLRNKACHVRTERDVLAKSFSSEWLVHLVYSFQDQKKLYLAMEYIPGGDVRSMLWALGYLSEDHCRFYIAEMILCVDALHRLGYIHRDLKPENFLITTSGHLKLGDFGLSRRGLEFMWNKTQKKLKIRSQTMRPDLDKVATAASQPFGSLRLQPSLLRKTQKKICYSVVGSCHYMAIEVLRGEGYDFAADWWSVGVMMFEFLVGLPPFYADDTNEVLRQVFHFESILQNPLDNDGAGLISPIPWELITKLVCEPEVRLGANVGFGKSLAKIQSHRFFDGVQWEKMLSLPPPFAPDLEHELDTSYFPEASEDHEESESDEDEPAEEPSEMSESDESTPSVTKSKNRYRMEKFAGFTFKRVRSPASGVGVPASEQHKRSSLTAMFDVSTPLRHQQDGSTGSDDRSVQAAVELLNPKP
mmetsp:Transcript_8396/g.25975  ORF Transcript_8396/g.25975 Transcript_8396/m.25975 type:complete len:1512 (-) Transcript_8396:180-4715(-)